MLPKLTLRIKLVGYLRNNFGAMIRSNGTFFLNLHRTEYTVFLILRLIKLTRIHEDSKGSACDVTHCVTKINYLEDSDCGHIWATNSLCHALR